MKQSNLKELAKHFSQPAGIVLSDTSAVFKMSLLVFEVKVMMVMLVDLQIQPANDKTQFLYQENTNTH